MKNKSIRVLKYISENIKNFLDSKNELCVERSRKNNIFDAILYRLYYTKYNSTQQKATAKLNSYKKIYDRTTRQSLAKKDNNLDISLYEDLSIYLSKLINDKMNCDHSYQIIAVDGIYPTLSGSLIKDGYIANKNNGSTTPLVNGLFNITTNMPVILDLVKNKCERSAFLNFIRNKDKFKDKIFLFDRGYQSMKMFDYMNDNNFRFICRIRGNSLLITNKVDDTFLSPNGHKLRIVTYTIKDKNYYIVTNIFDFTLGLIKNIYHDRWKIEEYYK